MPQFEYQALSKAVTARYSVLGTRYSAAALVAITLLGLALRLYDLTGYGIWWDEAYHVQLVKLPSIASMLDAVLSNPPSDPLYVLILRAWAGLFGTGDAALRSLSVLFGTATIPATYWLGRLLAGWQTGLLGALFFAISPYALELGQEGALYALAALTMTLALAAGWRWSSEGRGGLLYLLLGILAIYSHYVAAAILGLFAIVAWLLAPRPRPVRGYAWVGVHVAILCAWLPWLLALAIHWLNDPLPRATLPHRATVSEVLGALVQFTSGSSALLTGRRLLEAGGLLAGAGLLVAGWLAGRQEARHGLRVMLIIAAIIFAAPALVSAATGLWLFVPHFMIFLLPAIFCALAAGLLWATRVQGMPPITWYSVLATALLLIWLGAQAWGTVLFYNYPPHGVDGLRDLTQVLQTEGRPDDTVLIMPPILTPPVQQYYQARIHGLPADFDLRDVYPPFGNAAWNDNARSALEVDVRDHSRFWLIYSPYDDFNGDFLRGVTASYSQLAYHHYAFADLYLFGK